MDIDDLYVTPPKLYGNLPIDLGSVGEDIDASEMMFYLYLPIKLPGQVGVTMEERLIPFFPLVEKVVQDIGSGYVDKYIYITVKTLYVSPGCMGNREGYHSDGFMTNDINYIWYSEVPTVFLDIPGGVPLPQHHSESMIDMEWYGRFYNHRRYPNKHLLRLDERVIHKVCDESLYEGMRTFVKISVSDNIYAHKGNSVSPFLSLGVEYTERTIVRNCPVTHKGDVRWN